LRGITDQHGGIVCPGELDDARAHRQVTCPSREQA
jgi:hypothetical protein